MDFYNIQKSPLTKSTETFPTYLLENERLFVKPNTITSNINCDFLRKPLDPRWGYSIGLVGQYVYDPTVYGPLLLNTGSGTLTNSITGVNPTDKNPTTTIGVVQSATTGSGVGLTVSITTIGAAAAATVTDVSITSAGTGYASTDTVTFSGASFGGGVGGNLEITLQDSNFNSNRTRRIGANKFYIKNFILLRCCSKRPSNYSSCCFSNPARRKQLKKLIRYAKSKWWFNNRN